MLGSLILYLKGMRRMMFQLSGFYCIMTETLSPEPWIGLLRGQTMCHADRVWILRQSTRCYDRVFRLRGSGLQVLRLRVLGCGLHYGTIPQVSWMTLKLLTVGFGL